MRREGSGLRLRQSKRATIGLIVALGLSLALASGCREPEAPLPAAPDATAVAAALADPPTPDVAALTAEAVIKAALEGTPTPRVTAEALAAGDKVATFVAATLTAQPTATPDATATAAVIAAQVETSVAATLAAQPTPAHTPTDIPAPTATPTATPDPPTATPDPPTPSDTPTAPPPTMMPEPPAPTPSTANANANLRAGPGTVYAVVGQSSAGQPLALVGLSEDRQWYLLDSGAWISAALVDNPPPADTLPLAAAPPTPEPPAPAPGAAESYIPAGPFQMGCDSGDSECADAERPLHQVMLDAYFIDTYEVTLARYQACIDAGSCSPPQTTASETRANYYGNPDFAAHPVVGVTWHQARDFCAWEGKRLPTEAEWEKAARGSSDARLYPWGNQPPDCSLANFDPRGDLNRCVGDTASVGSTPAGASPYGVLDMSGNVWEWVADWNSAGYYARSPAANPTGPDAGETRVLRGGSFGRGDATLRVARRSADAPGVWSLDVGFRCARSQ